MTAPVFRPDPPLAITDLHVRVRNLEAMVSGSATGATGATGGMTGIQFNQDNVGGWLLITAPQLGPSGSNIRFVIDDTEGNAAFDVIATTADNEAVGVGTVVQATGTGDAYGAMLDANAASGGLAIGAYVSSATAGGGESTGIYIITDAADSARAVGLHIVPTSDLESIGILVRSQGAAGAKVVGANLDAIGSTLEAVALQIGAVDAGGGAYILRGWDGETDIGTLILEIGIDGNIHIPVGATVISDL